jgi:hypothetical protein
VKCVEKFLNNPDKINKEIFFVEDYLKISQKPLDLRLMIMKAITK